LNPNQKFEIVWEDNVFESLQSDIIDFAASN